MKFELPYSSPPGRSGGASGHEKRRAEPVRRGECKMCFCPTKTLVPPGRGFSSVMKSLILTKSLKEKNEAQN